MKKVFKVLVALICVLFLVSCEKIYPSKEDELMSFFKSHSIDVTYELRAQDISMEVFSLNVRKDVIKFETSEELDSETSVSFIIDYEKNNLIYDLGEKFIYTKIPNSNTTTELNVEKYISNISEVDGNLTFMFAMADYLEDSKLNLEDFMIYASYVKFTAVFKMNKIVELSYHIDGITVAMKIGGYAYKNNVKPESAGLEEIEFPNIADCLYLTEEEFMRHIEIGASGDIDNYELIVLYNDFAYINGQVIVSEFTGYIYDKRNKVRIKNIYLDDIYYNEEDIIASVDGKFNIYTDCCGKTFSAEIQVDKNPETIFDRYVFKVLYHDVTILRDEFTATYFHGYIYDTKLSKSIKDVGLEDLIYDIEDIISSKDGKIDISTELYGITFTTEIQAKIVNEDDLDAYKLIISNHDFTIMKGELSVSNVYGYIYDTVNKLPLENVYLNDIYYDEEKILSSEDHTFTVSTEYFGRVYTAEIQALSIYDANVETQTIPGDIGKIKYGFSLDNNVYLCDEKYLYKFDQKCENMIAKIDLYSIGKSHYIKDDYLYIASYCPYESTFQEDDTYSGYVAQIKLSTFTVEKQVEVSCLPNSIIVDNRNNVLLSKGANQWVFVDQVDMETGELTPLFQSYQNDTLSYNAHNDALLLVTPDHTGDNELYKYNDGKWVKVGYSSIKSDNLYSSSGDLLIFSNGIYRYDSSQDDYIFDKFNIIDMTVSYSFSTEYVIVDNNYAYIFEEVHGRYFNSLLVYNLNSGIYNRYFISETYNINISFMYKVAEEIYCIDTNGTIYKIKI